MKFDFTYNTKTQALNINRTDHYQAARLYVSPDTMWRYVENDWNNPEEALRPIFRLEVMVSFDGKTAIKTYQYENELGQALYVFMMNISIFNSPGIYVGSIHLNPQRFGRLIIKGNILFGDIYLNQINFKVISKIDAIKELRGLAKNIGLKEAKDYCDAAEHSDVKINELRELPTRTTYISFSRKS